MAATKPVRRIHVESATNDARFAVRVLGKAPTENERKREKPREQRPPWTLFAPKRGTSWTLDSRGCVWALVACCQCVQWPEHALAKKTGLVMAKKRRAWGGDTNAHEKTLTARRDGGGVMQASPPVRWCVFVSDRRLPEPTRCAGDLPRGIRWGWTTHGSGYDSGLLRRARLENRRDGASSRGSWWW